MSGACYVPHVLTGSLYHLGIEQRSSDTTDQEMINKQIDVMNWLLFLADGKHDLVGVCEHANCTFEESIATAEKLAKAGILQFSDR